MARLLFPEGRTNTFFALRTTFDMLYNPSKKTLQVGPYTAPEALSTRYILARLEIDHGRTAA